MYVWHCDAPAKINLTLRVGPLREDGFHPVESWVAQIELRDRLTTTLRDDGCLLLRCSDPSIPRDGRNLVLKAAEALRAALLRRGDPHAARRGAEVGIDKRIPAGAGLGGGSSDAAAALLMLNAAWEAAFDAAGLAAIAATIGSDVPLFLGAPQAVLRGRGEVVEPLDAALPLRCVLALPPIHSATGAVYAAFDRLPPPVERPPLTETLRRLGVAPTEAPVGCATPALQTQTCKVAAVRAGDVRPHLFNDLEGPALVANHELAAFAARLRGACPGVFHMTGSGAAFFALCDHDADAAALAARAAEATGCRVEVVSLARSPVCVQRSDSPR